MNVLPYPGERPCITASPRLRVSASVPSPISASFFCLLLAVTFLLTAARGEDRHPIYVGYRACAPCHEGAHMGNQTGKWLLSKHAKAYAALARPESKEIARLSGIPQEPQAAATCLGCHATGSEAEEWEKDETFSFKDGVQCEKCHGAGSEYMDAKVMTNHEAAVRNGLNVMTKEDCLNCHKEKDSHKKVLKQPPLDMEKAWREIAHPAPQEWELEGVQAAPAGDGREGCRYVCRLDRLRRMPCQARVRLPVQCLADEPTCQCLRRPRHAPGKSDRRADGRFRRSAGRSGVPEMPRHGVPRAGRRRPEFLLPS